MNVPREELQQVLNQLPALQRPTVVSLSDSDWIASDWIAPDWIDACTIVEEAVVRSIVPQSKEAGAKGIKRIKRIVDYPINKIIE